MKFEDIITIKGRSRVKRARKWPIDPSDRSKLLARRRTGIFINYYDRGRYAGGSDWEFYITPTVTNVQLSRSGTVHPYPFHLVQAESIGTGAGEIVVNFQATPTRFDFDQADAYAPAINAALFDTDPDTWHETYKKIEGLDQLDEYSLTCTGGTEYLAGYGFKPSPGAIDVGRIEVSAPGLHCSAFSTDGDIQWDSTLGGFSITDHKVTTEQDYAADAVAFTLDASCDVFLTPIMLFWWGCTGEPDIFTPVDDYETWILNALYKPLPRTLTINNADWDELRSSAYNGTNTFKQDLPSATRDWWYEASTTTPGARLLHLTGDDINDIGEEAADTFARGDGTLDHTSFQNQFIPYIAVMKFAVPEGVCVAAIKKKGVWYYVWNTDTIAIANHHYGGFV